MRLAVVAAGFTPGEADATAAGHGRLAKTGRDRSISCPKLLEGMQQRGLSEEFAEQVFQQTARFRRIWVSRVPCRQFCPAGVCLGLAETLLSSVLRGRH